MNTIIFITGMAGLGKSTVGRLVARRFPKCLFIQVDELREKMVRGYARPESGVFTEEVIQQFQMSRSTTIYMAHLYANQDVPVVIDDRLKPAANHAVSTAVDKAGFSNSFSGWSGERC